MKLFIDFIKRPQDVYIKNYDEWLQIYDVQTLYNWVRKGLVTDISIGAVANTTQLLDFLEWMEVLETKPNIHYHNIFHNTYFTISPELYSIIQSL